MFVLAACDQAPVATQTPGKPTLTAEPLRDTPIGFTPRPLPVTTHTPEPTSNLDVDEETLAGVQVHFWHPWAGELGKTIKTLVQDFNRNNEWGIEAFEEYKGGFDEIYRAVSEVLGTGKAPDLVAGYYYQGMRWNSDEDHVLDVNPYLNDPVWGLSIEEQKDFYPAFIELEQAADKRLGLPAERSAQLLYYNRSWAKELGFNSAPKTPAQFKRQACVAAQANLEDGESSNDGSGGLILTTDYDAILNWFFAFNEQTTMFGKDGYHFDTAEVEEAFSFLRDLYDEGCAWLPASELPAIEFAGRQGLFATGSPADIALQEAIFADLGSEDVWDIIPYPAEASEPTIVAYGPSFMLLRSNPKQELAGWLLIKWLTTPQAQARMASASLHFPVRISSLDSMGILPQKYPQWLAATKLLDSAKPEPQIYSWNIVRWAVSDAATQLFRYYFTINQVPELIELLDETADDLHESIP